MNKSVKTDLSSLVHRRLSEVLLFESNDPRFINVTISRVEASGNLTFANVLLLSVFSYFKAHKYRATSFPRSNIL